MLPCILPPPSHKVKVSLLRGGGGAAAPQLQSPHYHDYHHHQGTLRRAPALLTGRRVRRPPPRSRCLAPGSCHRGPPEPAAPPPQLGSGRGDTRQGPGCPARPRGPAPHTLRPWPAEGSAPPMPAAPRHPPGKAWSRGWGRARVPGLRSHQPERVRDRGSTPGRTGRLDLRAAAAASSAGPNLKRKKEKFVQRRRGRGRSEAWSWPVPSPSTRPRARAAPAPNLSARTTMPPQSYTTPTSQAPQLSCPPSQEDLVPRTRSRTICESQLSLVTSNPSKDSQ